MGLREEGYWDQHYELELKNFDEDGDEGEVWFGKGLNRRINDWLAEKLAERGDQSSSVADIGCGNGFTLCTLVDKYQKKVGHTNIDKLKLLGIDYSQNSVALSKRVVATKNLASDISLKQCDFLDIDQLRRVTNGERYDFVIDIGTFDAICLLNQSSLEAAKLRYLNSLSSIIDCKSIYILASCNHTEDEILSMFSLANSPLRKPKIVDRIETPKIQFGGKEGSQVTCLIFELHDALKSTVSA